MMTNQDPLELILSFGVEAMSKLILDTWRPSPEKRILLILPCSSKKPYRTSPSQRLYLSTVNSIPGAEATIEVVTLSAVFGIVPREFEELPLVLGYNLSLNRSEHTMGKHHEIIEILSIRVAKFLQAFGAHYSAAFFYGRERYVTVMDNAMRKSLPCDVLVIGSGSIRLKTDGLTVLKSVLEDELAAL